MEPDISDIFRADMYGNRSIEKEQSWEQAMNMFEESWVSDLGLAREGWIGSLEIVLRCAHPTPVERLAFWI